MKVERLLLALLERDLQLWLEGEELRYRGPKGALNAELAENLRGRRSELLAFLKQGERYAAPSFAQRRLWFLDQLGTNGPAYHIPDAFHLRGRLEPRVLEGALRKIVERHEPLRTRFANVDGEAVQVIASPAPFVLPVVDLTGLDAARRRREAAAHAEGVARRPFILACGPLVAFALFRIAAGEYQLAFNLHHIIADGSSLGVLYRELAELYGAATAGRPAVLSKLLARYTDFASWQRRQLAGARLEEEIERRRERLAELPALALPIDRPRPAVGGYRGAVERFAVPPETVGALRRLGVTSGASLYMTALAAFLTLLHRQSGQDVIVVGTPIANRNRRELEDLIGFFVNMLVIRADLESATAFTTFLAQVRELALEAYAHQDVPFEKLVEALRPERTMNRQPLFQVVFALQNTAELEMRLPGLEVSRSELRFKTARFDLEMHLCETDLGGYFSYSPDLFDRTNIARLALAFKTLLRAVAENGETPLGRLPILPTAERHQLLTEWNDRPSSYPRRTVDEEFERRADEGPDRVALLSAVDGRQISYRELDRRADRLAEMLLQSGAKRGARVGVSIERSPEMVASALAVLKVGAAYVPLDPSYPRGRLAFMLSDARVEAVLADNDRLAALLPSDRVVFPGAANDGKTPSGRSDRARPHHSTGRREPLDLAYLMYTSGSTGRAKGVAIPHRGVMRLARGNGYAHLDAEETWLQISPFAFDGSTLEIWGALLHGGRLVVAPPETPTAEELGQIFLRHRITTTLLTGALFELMVEERLDDLRGLRQLLTGGDTLMPHRARATLRRLRGTVLINAYGPTETTTLSTTFKVSRRAALSASVPIGCPITDTRICVTDRWLEMVSPGTPGELCAGGGGLARGYHDQPVRTATRFVPDPFGDAPGERLYRTGDRVRGLANGLFDFLGRFDQQVKIRGFRVEPGEIEAVLESHPAVRRAVVLARPVRPLEASPKGFGVDDGLASCGRCSNASLPSPRVALRSRTRGRPLRSPSEKLRATAMVAFLERSELRPDGGHARGENSAAWRALYDDLYRRDGEAPPEVDFRGWNSSYTGRPIPVEEMREWADRTAERLLGTGSRAPRRVLEIGCGSGLLLTRIAPQVEHYLGTDFSRPVLESLAARLAGRLPQVRLLERRAEDRSGIGTDFYDLVILNSVVQYFSGVEELLEVLDGAVEAAASEGTVFVGDVRSLPLLETFCASVELARASASLKAAALRERAARRVAQEEELVIDPAFFSAYARCRPRVRQMRIRPKGGRFHNEMTRFRYDVELEIQDGRPARQAALRMGDDLPELDWTQEGLTKAKLRELLERERPATLRIRRIPNARLVREARLLEILLQSDGTVSAGALREQLAALPTVGLEPDDFSPRAALGDFSSRDHDDAETSNPWGDYRVELCWRDHGADGRFDAVFLRQKGSRPPIVTDHELAEDEPPPHERAWSTFTNDPLHGRAARVLIPRLHEHLRERLPAYMALTDFVLLGSLPLLPNGKVDRKALERSAQLAEVGHRDLPEAYIAPRDAVEEALARIWTEVLGIDQVGIHDNFFELGGHSLLATQVISRARAFWGIELPIRALFERPTIAGLAPAIERAAPGSGTKGDRRKVGGAINITSRAGEGPAPPIERAPRAGELPLSFAQERLWFLHQLDPRNSAYNVPAAYRLRGHLDTVLLERSFSEIVRRHEALRTTFPSVDGRPQQVILREARLACPRIDLAGLGAGRRSAEARRLVDREARRPFDPERGPLARAVLVRCTSEEHILLLLFHHLVSDGWSQVLFRRELRDLYLAFSERRGSPFPELAIQYADFAAWQKRVLRGVKLAKLLEYWRLELADLPVLDLPTDRPLSDHRSRHGAFFSFALEGDLNEALDRTSRAAGATRFMTLLAGFFALIQRTSGQDDLAVGSPIANRNRREIEGLMGFFVNTLVLRARRTRNFAGLLAQVKETALAAYSHQDLPFEKLVEELRPTRDLSQSPLFRVFFALHNVPRDQGWSLPGLEMSTFHFDPGTTLFDLSLALYETPRGLDGWIRYSTELFHATTIDRLARQYQIVLKEATADPRRRLDELPLMAPAERHQLLTEWNADPPLTSSARTVVEAFAAQVMSVPDRAAVVYGKSWLSYRELDRRAGQLSQDLARGGVGFDDRVGLLVERSLEMAVGLLGTLQAGAAYVPLDPSYPRERLTYMTETARCTVVITLERSAAEQSHSSDGFRHPRVGRPGVSSWRRQRSLRSEFCRCPGERVGTPGSGMPRSGAALPHPENLAYVTFTSGSTGRPKGIAMSHGVVMSLIAWHLETLLGRSRSLQFASLNFDGSFHEIFATWCAAGCLVIVPEATRRDVVALARLVSERGIEKAKLPASLLPRFAEECLRRDLPLALREITASGEALRITPAVVELFARHPQIRLHNHYGPTETHAVAAHPLSGPSQLWPSRPPIGRSISGVALTLCDRRLRPVPIGVVGEIYAGGVPPARGYFDHPGLTAAKFLPDLFGLRAGGRLYRTGDLARVSPAGQLLFLGRGDHQVKIRGFRVELGEIEAVLAEHPAMRDAAVVHRSTAPGDERLTAFYVVASNASDPGPRQLRRYLGSRLPRYMVPAIFVALDQLPLSPAGKIDRRQLPADVAARPEPSSTFVPPRRGDEEVLAEIWNRVLGVSTVGAHDDFFELGGHSLLATQVASRVRSTFQVELGVRSLFEHPTVAALAEKLRALRLSEAAGTSKPPPPLRPVPRAADLPLSFAQERLWFLDQLEPGCSIYNLPAAWLVEGSLDRRALAAALEEIIGRHEGLRTAFPRAADGRPRQLIAPPEPFSLPLVDLTVLPFQAALDRARRNADAEAARSFELERGPLFVGILWRLGPRRYLFFVNVHHIVFDGWSHGVFYRQLEMLYAAFSRGQPISLARPTVHYADFALWQRRWLRGSVLETHLGWWRKQLADTPALELVTDRPRKIPRSHRGKAVPLALDEMAGAALGSLSRDTGTSLFMVLLTAFSAVLHRNTGQSRLAFGTPVAHRNRQETEEMIGFFVNTLVLVGDLSRDPTTAELLGRWRESALGAYDHQDLPFEKLVAELRPERNLASNPLFQVLFALGNTPRSEARLAGASLEKVRLGWTRSRFDLELHMWEEDRCLRGAAIYNPDLFDRTTVLRLNERFQGLLRHLVAHRDDRLSELPMLSPAARHQLFWEWGSGPKVETPLHDLPSPCLHHLVEAVCGNIPEAICVTFEGRRLTYRELDRQADRLALELRRWGAGPETTVGLGLERSPEMVIALLAVLKAGAAYLPLDPDLPAARRRFMVADADPVVLLENRPPGWEVVSLRHAVPSDEPPPLGPDPGSLAYVLYTSGSTGQPKAVAISHRNAVHRISWARRAFAPQELAGVLAATPLSFDLSVFELFVPLCAGGKIILSRHILELPQLEAAGEVTLINTVPSALKGLLPDLPRSLRSLNLAGEPLVRSLIDGLRDRDLRVRNLYGPSEDTTYSTYATVDPDDGRPPPIGQPLDGTRVCLLGQRLETVPAGIPGELSLAGAGLARGYLRQPDRTAETFVPDPRSPLPGGRLYKTGDLARYNARGELLFLGRYDHQVQLRGHRVELGEIESVLKSTPGVADAVVLAREDRPGSPGLVAFLVANGKAAQPEGLRARLRLRLGEKLPAYMIPASFVVLESLPRLPSGKVDRKALERRPRVRPQLMRVAPGTAVEAKLAEIWRRVLEIDGFGMDDHFFDLGGHSLDLLEVRGALLETFGQDLPLAELFRRSTIRSLARHLEDRNEPEEDAGRRLVELRLGRRDSLERLRRRRRREPGRGGASL